MRNQSFALVVLLGIDSSGHKKKGNKKFEVYTERVWAKLIELVGDKEFEQVTRVDASEFISMRLAEGARTATVDRQVSVLRAVFNVVILEKELASRNPFLKPRIAGLGRDSMRRGTFDKDQLSTLIKECKKRDDDVRG